METPNRLENIQIIPFDFTNSDLVNKSIDLLNSNSVNKKHDIKFWRWRFDSNPFADSYGWYAKENDTGELAAILLYWPWKFNHNNHEYLFYQAINGITNKKFRNLGVFLELNNRAIDFFNQKKHSLFGIPNGQSYPTYNKLGWQTVEKINPYFIPLSPFKTVLRYTFGKQIKPSASLEKYILKPFDCLNEEPDKIMTKWTKKLMEWRFINHPLFNYYVYHNNGSSLIFKLKKREKITEAQIVLSCMMTSKCFKDFKTVLKKHHIDLLSYYGTNTILKEIIQKETLKIKQKKALYLVLKNTPELIGIPFKLELAERDTT